MKKGLKKVYIPLLVTFAFALLSLSLLPLKAEARRSSIPKWVKTGEDSSYPLKKYLSAMGEGDTIEEADKMALVRIAEQIQVSIKSELDISKSFSSHDEEVKTSKEMSHKIKSAVDIDKMEGISVVSRYLDEKDNLHYSFAVLDRAASGKSLGRAVRESYAFASEFFDNAEEHKGKGEIARSVNNYARALEEFSKGRAKERILNVVSPDTRAVSMVSQPQIEAGLSDLLSKCRLDIVSGNNQKGEFGKALNKELVVKAIYNSGEGVQPIKGLAIKFEIVTGIGKLKEEVSTDNNGLAVSSVYRVEPSGEKNNLVKATLDYPGVDISKSGLSRTFTYTLPIKEDVNIAVNIREENLGSPLRAPIVAPIIIQSLRDSGFNVLPAKDKGKGDYVIRGSLNTAKRGEFHNVKFALTSGEVEIFDNRTNSIVASVEIDPDSAKGAGTNIKAAGLKSLKKSGEAVGERIVEEMELLFSGE